MSTYVQLQPEGPPTEDHHVQKIKVAELLKASKLRIESPDFRGSNFGSEPSPAVSGANAGRSK